MSSVSNSDSKKNLPQAMLFCKAVHDGNIESVKDALRQGADVNYLGSSGCSALHVAALNGHFEIIEYLIKSGAKVNAALFGSAITGFTPLYMACYMNHDKCVKVLLENGASITSDSADLCQPIHIAVVQNCVEIARLLLDKGADVNLRFNDKFFHNKWDKTILWKDMDLTLLHCSIARKLKEMTALLLEYGADIHLKTRSNKTSLMHAVEANDPELVELLLAKGANPNDQDLTNKPVIFYVIINANAYESIYHKEELDSNEEKLKIMKLLCNAGANINANFQLIDPYNLLIHYAIMHVQIRIVEFILFETDFNYQNLDHKAFELSALKPHLLTEDQQTDAKFVDYLIGEFMKAKYILVLYTFSRHMIGFTVQKTLLLAAEQSDILSISPSIMQLSQDLMKRKVQRVIDKMKKTFIGNTIISYRRIVTCKKSELIKFSRNKKLRSLCVSDYQNKFYLYHYTIKSRLEAAIKQSILFEQTIEKISSLFSDHFSYDCCERIATFFNYEELKEFVNL